MRRMLDRFDRAMARVDTLLAGACLLAAVILNVVLVIGRFAFNYSANAMEELSVLAFAAYRDLVYETPRFVEFFREMTPLGEIAELNVGSRPAARSASGRIEDLRAIPWVFSWSQCRLMIPGWYGAGTAFDAWAGTNSGRLQTLRAMYGGWPSSLDRV